MGVKVKVFKVKDIEHMVFTYLNVTKFANKLRPREIEVLSKIIKYYFKYKEQILSDDLISVVLSSYDTKMKIKSELDDMHDEIFQNIVSSLRKKKALNGYVVNKAYLPNIDKGEFSLTYKFVIDDKSTTGTRSNKKDSGKV